MMQAKMMSSTKSCSLSSNFQPERLCTLLNWLKNARHQLLPSTQQTLVRSCSHLANRENGVYRKGEVDTEEAVNRCELTQCFHSGASESKSFPKPRLMPGTACQYHDYSDGKSISQSIESTSTFITDLSEKQTPPDVKLSSKKWHQTYLRKLGASKCDFFLHQHRLNLSYTVLRFYCTDAKNIKEDEKLEDKDLTDVSGTELEEDDDFHDFSSQDLMSYSPEPDSLSGVQETLPEPVTHDDTKAPTLTRRPAASLSLPELARRKPATLAPYVNRSETLQKLIQLGVDLSAVQQMEGMASLLVRSKFERDIVPYIKFLHRVRVPSDKLGRVLTINPHILTMPIEELELRIGYLVHKKFTLSQIGVMIGRAPVILLMTPEKVDEKLAFFQQIFSLSAYEVRQVFNSVPKLLPYKKEKIALCSFQVKSFLGFTDSETKQLILKEPRIFMTESRLMENNFDYLHNTMLIPHDQILTFPGILLHRIHILKSRNLFLLSCHRAQYDPCKENYVSLKALVSGSDADFCQNVAKCDLKTYYDFLKTL